MVDDEQTEKQTKKITSRKRLVAIIAPITGVTLVALLFFMFLGEENFFASDDLRDRTYSTEERIYMMEDGNIVRARFAIEVSHEQDRTSLINGRKVIDWMISNAISEFDLDRIGGKTGRDALENEIEEGIREEFPGLQIEKVYITSFVIT